ncbi:MAG: hypothetical protein D6714_20430, partial [Bacteroidetes bacterium]
MHRFGAVRRFWYSQNFRECVKLINSIKKNGMNHLLHKVELRACFSALIQFALFLLFLFQFQTIWAEGSKDFVNYPGHRLYLDTRDPQQMKVYAGPGEFINVGASHVGMNGGFIQVYRPDGTLHATFDDNSLGVAVIHNNVEEQNGPIGGGLGYIPGVVQVDTANAGIWTVIFDYPDYEEATFPNILNSAPWDLTNQPSTRTVVLSWDITVSQGAAGDQGGTLLEGRVYSNEYISLLRGNGVTTSPVFYVFTQDGYLYEVTFSETDPFRFPISSNSFGLVTGDLKPIYKSKNESEFRRDADPASWSPDSLYLYEPQAEDFGPLVNNKIFFNPPASDMPSTAMNTDIFRNNTHQTWLYNNLLQLEIDTFFFQGFDPDLIGCPGNVMEFSSGGWFIISANANGQATLELDLNENGLFGDPEDITIQQNLEAGIDSIFWDGNNGLGNPIPIDPSFTMTYRGSIRYGEIHISMTDIENNLGGVTFKLLNAPPNVPDSLFFYDHSDIGGAVSGGGTPGNALPTSTPYTYSGNFGNNRFLDQWIFTTFNIAETPVTIEVVQDCPCDALGATPNLVIPQPNLSACEGSSVVLMAMNNPDSATTNIDSLTYMWSGPGGFIFEETLAPGDTSRLALNNLTLATAGIYTVTSTSNLGCSDGPDTLNLTVFPGLNITSLIGGGDICPAASHEISA